MVDYHRMVWQYRINRISEIGLILCVLLLVPEIVVVIKYHFPWFIDLIGIVIIVLGSTCLFVKKYTDMYRIDF